MLPSYAVIFRTHVWDSGIAEQAKRARTCCASGKFVIAADETKGPLQVDGFSKLSHTDDFSAYGLPNIPAGQVLWWNADYVLYEARRALPEYGYYIMLEYDVYLNADIDRMISKCNENKVDFVAQHIQRIDDDHWSAKSASEMGTDQWWALIPFIIVSGRAIDMMLHTRQMLAAALAAGQISNWPYCEPFLPTAVAQHPAFTSWSLDQLVDSQLLRFRPALSTRDPRLRKAEIVAHPVFARARFIETFITHNPTGSHYMTDGRLRNELQTEELHHLQAVLGDQVRYQQNPDGTWSFINCAVPSQQEVSRPWIDLSYGKPATQSSHSRWSHGTSAEADAALANYDPHPDDYAFHTDAEEDPWWQVDLMEICIIERIEIVNRVKQPHKFNHFRIDTSQNGKEWTTCFTKLDNASVSSDPKYPAQFTLQYQVQARFLRIIQLGTNTMHLRRVRVLGFLLNALTPENGYYR